MIEAVTEAPEERVENGVWSTTGPNCVAASSAMVSI